MNEIILIKGDISNEIIKPVSCSFEEEKLKEVDHLQKCIISNPEILGEPILIIAKEFNEFDKINKRLDILGLDKNGFLIVIELKRSSTPDNVISQILNYTAYCHALCSEEIINIYAKYSNQTYEKCKRDICNFIECNGEDFILNPEDSIRSIIVASDFSIEVNAAIYWLEKRGIHIERIKHKLHKVQDGSLYVISFEKLGALIGNEDYIIRLERKNLKDGWSKEFWIQYQCFIKDKGDEIGFSKMKPSQTTWMKKALGIGGVNLCLTANRRCISVQIIIETPDLERNKDIFFQIQEECKNTSSSEIKWRENSKHKMIRCDIGIEKPVDASERTNWPKINIFLYENSMKFYKNFFPIINKIKNNN